SSGPGGKRFEDKIVDTLKKYVNEGAYLSKKWLKKHLLIQSFAPSSHTMLPCQLKILNQRSRYIPTPATLRSMWWDRTMEGYNCSSNEQLQIWSKELTLIIYRCMHTSTGMNTSTYTLNFSDKTHTRSMRLKSMDSSLLSLVASITFKPQRQLLAQIAS
ncbi:hypothetical protein IGI04_006308, partial [Brassica rapa subsp. trilocularis]